MRWVPAPYDHAHPARELVGWLHQRVGAKRRLPHVCECAVTRVCRARWSKNSANRHPRRTLVSQHGPPAVRPRRVWAVMPRAMGLAPAPRSPEAGKPRGWWGAAANPTRFLERKQSCVRLYNIDPRVDPLSRSLWPSRPGRLPACPSTHWTTRSRSGHRGRSV
jgi:hypothetical protein